MTNPEKNNSPKETQPNNNNLPISTEVQSSQEGINLSKNTKENLDKLKKELENGKVTPEFIRSFLEVLPKLDQSNKAFILGGVFSSLNKMGISIKEIKNGQISLQRPKNMLIDGENQKATDDEIVNFENLLNSGLRNQNFTLNDLQNSLLARTLPSMDKFKQNSLDKSLSTTDYAIYLHKKYNISFQKIDGSDDNKSKTKEYFSQIHFEDENKYKQFKATIGNAIKENQAEKEFLLSFYDNLYYNKGENIDDNSFESILKTGKENEVQIFQELNQLSTDEKLALGIHSKNTQEEMARKWTNNPIEAITDSIKNGGLHLGLIFGIIGAIFWGKKGFFGGIFAGLGIAGGGLEAITSMFNKDRKKGEKPSASSNSDKPRNKGESKNENVNLYKKYEGVVSGISTDSNEKKDYLEVWETLSKNESLMNSKILEIPINGSTEEKMQFFVNNCGFYYGFLIHNQDKIKEIYEAILNKRKNSIGDYNENETLKEYLERTSGKEEKEKKDDTTSAGSTVNNAIDNNNSGNGFSIENLKREGYSDLYILSRGIELGYTFTKTLPSWVKPSGSMGIIGSTWYVIKTPLSMQTYKYLANTGGYFMTGGLHNSMNNGNLGKITEGTGKGLNWLGKGAGKILGTELMIEKSKLNKHLDNLKLNLSGNEVEINKLNSKIQILEKLETEMKRGNIGEVKRLLREYRTNFDSNFRLKNKGRKDVELKAHLDKFKLEEDKINKIKSDLEAKITELENKSKTEKDPKKIEKYKKEVEELAKKSNIEIEEINKKAGISLSKLDEGTIKSIATQSKFVDNIVKFNGGAEKFLNKFNGVGGKAFIGVGIISLIYNGREGLGSIWDNGFSNENKNDAIDLGIGFIPIIGGLHDLKIAWDGEDLNDRKLSSGERLTRTAFGIVGLIPGAGILAKGVFKGSVAVSKGVNIAIQTTNIVGKGLTYSMLGFSIATATKEIILD
ncbi:hypothetical protein H3C61_01105 [Candidatus Gracilibacteria bacterium]|nr:hypothetical protein [Candidatus Gracilibacteria bacterium]